MCKSAMHFEFDSKWWNSFRQCFGEYCRREQIHRQRRHAQRHSAQTVILDHQGLVWWRIVCMRPVKKKGQMNAPRHHTGSTTVRTYPYYRDVSPGTYRPCSLYIPTSSGTPCYFFSKEEVWQQEAFNHIWGLGSNIENHRGSSFRQQDFVFIMKLRSWTVGLLVACCFTYQSCMPVRNRQLDLNLLEELLDPLGKGGAAKKIGRLCRAIAEGTQGAHHSIQEIAALRGNTDKSAFERSLHSWVSRQTFAEWLPRPCSRTHPS